MGNRVDIAISAKELSDQDIELFNELHKEHGDKKKTFLYLLECARKIRNESAARLRGNVTLNYIDDLVKRQMETNRTTEKTHVIGSGKTTVSVKFEQRSITDKWIMDTSIEERDNGIEGARSVSRKAAQEYIALKKSEIDEHHEWLCKQVGLDFTPDNVRNFNRRTGKAAAAAARLGE